ncbi:hypothetical protein IQ254_23530 [Nodosilinea sp. LEGE 07088]|uniref:hypothetical protein n=1 Tax=Nodosilinea sp. LEGE 07088 TaxID=2777968 RepID=UPI001880559B|nr:hypothetical protein [Nodosilinea sp. LEGE 07088]MBE9140132.1 hypothetical protein [Nodosilinea sp. LEGE 07088]
MTTTQREMIQKGYQALVDALGSVDAIRFIQHFSPGKGDYTQDRHQWLDQITEEDFFTQIKQAQDVNADGNFENYEEIIE